MAGSLKAVATSGSYTDLTSKPSLGTQMSADTGWTGNAGAGDKTASVPNWVSGGITGTMVTALNVTSAGLGTLMASMDSQMQAMTKKIQALETALAAGKLPNA